MEREMSRHDHWPQADGNAEIRHDEQAEGGKEGTVLGLGVERVPSVPDQGKGYDRYRRQERDVRPGEPARRDMRVGIWCPQADKADGERGHDQAPPAVRSGPIL